MSQQNVDRLRVYLEAFDSDALSRGEVQFAFLAPDITYADEILPDHVSEVGRRADASAAIAEQLAIEAAQADVARREARRARVPGPAPAAPTLAPAAPAPAPAAPCFDPAGHPC